MATLCTFRTHRDVTQLPGRNKSRPLRVAGCPVAMGAAFADGYCAPALGRGVFTRSHRPHRLYYTSMDYRCSCSLQRVNGGDGLEEPVT